MSKKNNSSNVDEANVDEATVVEEELVIPDDECCSGLKPETYPEQETNHEQETSNAIEKELNAESNNYFTGIEQGIINVALQVDDQGRARKIAYTDWELVKGILDKVTATVVDNKFQDAEIVFTTVEKVFILEQLKRPWSIVDFLAVEKIEKKLS